jgi:hypothetical protein
MDVGVLRAFYLVSAFERYLKFCKIACACICVCSSMQCEWWHILSPQSALQLRWWDEWDTERCDWETICGIKYVLLMRMRNVEWVIIIFFFFVFFFLSVAFKQREWVCSRYRRANCRLPMGEYDDSGVDWKRLHELPPQKLTNFGLLRFGLTLIGQGHGD